jgi:hypothetical protein
VSHGVAVGFGLGEAGGRRCVVHVPTIPHVTVTVNGCSV